MQNEFSVTDEINLREIDFNLAFGVIDYESQKSVMEELVESGDVLKKVYLQKRESLSVAEQAAQMEVKTHKCTPEDFDKFYEVSSDQLKFFDVLKKESALYCLDPDQDLKISGTDEIDSLALNFEYLVSPTTTLTQSELQQKMGHPELVILHNSQRFKSDRYKKKEFIINESKLWN